MGKEENNSFVSAEHHHVQHQQFEPQYGTFQGVPNYPPPPPPPVIGLPQPAPPPGAFQPSAPPSYPPQYYAHGYQSVPGYAIAEGTPVRERRLPCCGIGVGWFLLSLLPLLLFLVLQKEAMTGDLGVMCYIRSKMDLCTRRICWKFTVFICYVSLRFAW
ncbi:hypothetical protein I3843_11G065600 [Carya illinoinensis]|nr:hypothetical protein I3843_11G065600 [Carya illinoinensis]